jgi:hypothetical protein
MSERDIIYTVTTEAEINDNEEQERRAAVVRKTGLLLASWRSRFTSDAISKSYPYSDGTIALHSVTPDSLTINYTADNRLRAAYQFDKPSGELYGMTYAEDGTGAPMQISNDTYERVSLALFECDRVELRASRETE